jgi:hypothetical protein
VAYKWS